MMKSYQDFECGEFGYKCSAILNAPRIPRSMNMPLSSNKMGE